MPKRDKLLSKATNGMSFDNWVNRNKPVIITGVADKWAGWYLRLRSGSRKSPR